MTSGGIPFSATGTRERSTRIPRPAAAPSSDVAHAIPPAPRSLYPMAAPCSRDEARAPRPSATVSILFRNGSGTCTAYLSPSARSSSRMREAKVAPPNPDGSVGFPTRIASYGASRASTGTLLRTTAASSTIPSAITFTRQFSSNERSNDTSPPRFGTPSAFPYCQMPSTTPWAISRVRSPFGPRRVAEPQGVEHADDVRAHAVHVAHDAADAGGRALVRDDLGRVVVALVRHDEAPGLPVGLAQPDDPGVLAGSEDHVRGARGKVRAERLPAALVGAVLAPHRVEDVGLDDGGVAPQEGRDLPRLVERERDAGRGERAAEGLVVCREDPDGGNGGAPGQRSPRGLLELEVVHPARAVPEQCERHDVADARARRSPASPRGRCPLLRRPRRR